MADNYRYEPITSGRIRTAEEMAREIEARAKRKEEEDQRKAELLEEARQQAIKREDRDRKYSGQKSHPRTKRPKSIEVDGEEKPIEKALAEVPAQLDFEQMVRSSPLRERALAQSRTEELVAEGKSQEEAAAQARQEREDRQAAFNKARDITRIRNEGGDALDNEPRDLASGLVESALAPLARMAGYPQVANNQEAATAGRQAAMDEQRDKYQYPEVIRATSGAANSLTQMVPGIAASAVAGPAVGMGVMAAQFGTQEYSRAQYEGAEAGIAGDELERYALTQAGIEASIMPIMSKIPGMAGLEGRVLRQGIAKSVMSHPTMRQAIASGAKKLTKETAAELTEEVITEVSHGYADSKFLDKDVDYKAIIKDTVAQTLITMGLAEVGQQAGRLANRDGRQPVDPATQPAETPDPAAGSAEPENRQVAASEVTPQATPEELAFIENPSRKKYEAAVKAGMPESPKGMARDRRVIYAEERRQLQNQDLVPTQDPAPLEPVQQEAQSSNVPDDEVDSFIQELSGGSSNVQETNVQRQIRQGREEGYQGAPIDEGRQQEGLLNDSPAGMQDGGTPAGSVEPIRPEPSSDTTGLRGAVGGAGAAIADNFYEAVYDSIKKTGEVPSPERKSSLGKAWSEAKKAGTSPEDFITQLRDGNRPKPAAHTRESFEAEYRDTFKKMMSYPPDQAGHKIYVEKMADLYDSNPEWAKEIENTPSPVGGTGDVRPDQSLPPATDPASSEPAEYGTRSDTQKWGIYKTIFQGKPKFSVKETDKGFGDALFDSDEEAKVYADTGRQRETERAAADAKRQATEEADQKKQQEYEDSFQGFLTDDPKTKGNRLKTLNQSLKYKDQVTTRKQLVEQKVTDGWTVNDQDRLQSPTGEFLDNRDLTKTGIDYARHLVNQKPVSAPETSPVPAFLALPKKSQDLFNKAFESKDVDSLKQMVDKNNLAWNSEFTNRTGIKLPKTLKDRQQAVVNWASQAQTPSPATAQPVQPKPTAETTDDSDPIVVTKEWTDKEIVAASGKTGVKPERKIVVVDQQGRTLAITKSKLYGDWSVSERDGRVDKVWASGIMALDKAKDVSRRVLKDKFVMDSDLVYGKRASGTLGLTNAELGKDIGRQTNKEKLAGTLIRYGLASNGAVMLRVSDKERDSILKGIGSDVVPSVVGYPAANDIMEEMKRTLPNLADAEILGFRGGDYQDATVAVRDSKTKEITVFGQKYVDTARKKYPNATLKLAGDKLILAEGENVVGLVIGRMEPKDYHHDMLKKKQDDYPWKFDPEMEQEAVKETPAESPSTKKPKAEKPEVAEKPAPKAKEAAAGSQKPEKSLYDMLKEVDELLDSQGRVKDDRLLKRRDELERLIQEEVKTEEPAAGSRPVDPRAALRDKLREAMAAEVKRKADEKDAKESKPKPPKAPKPETAQRPKSQDKETAEQRTQKSRENRDRAAEAIRQKLKEMGRAPNMVVIPADLVKLVADYAIASMDLGISTFREFVVDFKDTFGEKNARELSDAVEEAWGLLPEFGHEVDAVGKVADVLGPESEATPAESQKPESGKSPALDLVDSLETELLTNKGIEAKRLWELADKAYGGTRAEGKYGPSEAYDALETAINLTILNSRQMGMKTPAGQVSPETALRNILDMQKQIVSQTNRSGTKDTMQQFSTPPAYSYVVSQFVNMDARDVVLEPSAGTGDLAIHALNQRAKVHVNELDPKRAEMLKAIQESEDARLTISTEDALQLGNIMGSNLRPSVVLMNPPFSREGQRMGDKKMSGNDRNHIDAAMASLVDGGRLVAIIGAGLHGPSKGFTSWLAETAKKHNVRANIEVNRDVYKGYGTTFPTRVLVIDKGTPTPKDGTLTAQADSLEQLLTMTKGIRNDRNRLTSQPVSPGDNVPGTAVKDEGKGKPEVPAGSGTVAGSSRKPNGNTSGTTEKAPKPAAGASGGNVADGTGRRPGTADSKGTGRESVAGSEPAGRGTTDAAGEPTGNPAGEPTQPRRVAEKRTEIDESVLFEPYQPSIVPFPNAKPHPTAAVESAAMAAVEYPEVTEIPNIDASIIEDGRLSDVQLEFVALAAHAHNQLLPSEERTGILFGDGTGMGKGRGIPGVILHNWNEGRRQAIWMSKNGKLHSDAMREWEELGGNPAQVANLSDMPVDDSIDLNEGILFATYDTLKSRGKSGKTRAQQVIDWLPADFDGVIAFDEAHLMGSDTAARAGVARDIQDKFPKARVVYASATAATEIDQLMFGSRLGLWGAATPFATAKDFAAKIGSAGVSAMESVALSLKAMGRYVSRSISFNDGTPDGTVGYKRLSHPLADHQIQMYDRLAEAWQKVIGEFEESMDATGADNFARGFARGQFWSAHQRFFNDLVTSLQMPTVIESIEKDMAEGRSVVIQLTTTGAAQQARALAGRGTQSLDDFAVDPFSSLVELVRSQFPTQAYEEYLKDDGSVGKRPVVDSNGKPVKDAAAVEKQQQLLSDLAEMEQAMPDSPLDMILNYFGTENVAEITGRNQRVVWQEQQDGTKKRVLEKRSQKKSNQADIDAFQSGKKRILVFSQAGGTGASYHADRRAANQEKRMHYLVQPGWVAADAIQGLGRTHRTNQKQAPEYILVQTDIPGQKRFISTIARRLTQLGALTRGQRTAGGSGVFDATDNLESTEAALALTEFFKSLSTEDAVMSLDEFEEQTGLELRLRSTGEMKSDVNLPDITSFMNRILSMKIDSQNKVFDAFDTMLKNITEARRISGELDQGVETIKGNNIRKTRDEVVFTHDSGAKTRYVQLTMEVPIKSIDFNTQSKAERYKDFIGYFKRKSDGRVFFVNKSFSKTSKSGQVVDMVRLVPPYGESIREEEYTLDLGKLEKITPGEAESLWNEQFGSRPKTKSQKVDMITGAVLPVWDRLPQLQPKLSRALTASGDMVLGVVLPQSKVNETLGKLGAEKNKVNVGSTIQMLRTGKGDVQLVNGWKIQRVRVQNEWRLEIVGPTPVSEIVFQRQGVITERIGFKARYFIPFGENTQTVFDAVTRGNPIQNVNRYDSVDSDDDGPGDEEESDTAEPSGTATQDPATGDGGPSELRAAADKARAELEAIREKNAEDDKIIGREWKNLGPATFAPLTPELLNALGRRIVGSIRAGAKSFEVVIREMRANIADDALIGLKPNLIRAWNSLQSKYDLNPATEAAFEAAMVNDADVDKVIEAAKGEPAIADPANLQVAGSASTPPADPATPAADMWSEEPTIGINKAKRAERRDKLGLEQEDVVNKLGHSFPELDAEAKRVSPGEAEDVFTRIGTGGEAADNASDRDVFVMLNHYAQKQMETKKTLAELESARADGDALRVSELESKLNLQVAEEIRLMDIARSAGTAAGRALQAFKALLKEDMSLARLRMRLDAAADGTPTDAQLRKMNELHAKYEAVLKELEAKTKEVEEAIARAEIAERIAAELEANSKPGKSKADRRLEAAWKPFQKAEMFFSVTGALQLLPEFTELAGAYIEKGVETFSDFVEKLTTRFGRQPKPETVPVLQQAWDAAWDKERKPPEVSVEPDHPQSLVNAAKALFRHFLSQGITDTDQVIEAVHNELSKQFPEEVTEYLDTMKAMVDYDKIRTVSQDPFEALAADKRAVVQMRVHLEKMRRGIAPNRIEQRHPITDEQRQHRKMVNEAKRKGGFIVTDPERQASSALAALETRLRHSISDTLNEIATGVRVVPEKTVGPTSDTTEDLQAYLALIKGMHKDIFGDRTMTQEQKLKAAEAAAVKNEAYWNDRLARAKAGDFSTGKSKPNPVTNAQIDAIKARSDLAKAQVQELKELAKPKRDPEAIADAQYLAGLERQLAAKLARIADITARAAKGDFAPERNITKEKREANELRRKSNQGIRDARIKLEAATREMNEHIEQVRKKNLTYVELAKRVPGAAWATLRDLKLTGELSFILRQGAPRVFGAIVPAGKLARAGVEALSGNTDAAMMKLKQAGQGYKQLGRTLARTLKAAFWKTDTELAKSMDELKQRPNYVNGTYEAMKLSLHEDGGKYSVAEELFINNLVELAGLALDKRFDGFEGFRNSNPFFTKTAHNLNLANRISNATKVFMNEMRADIADDAVALWTVKAGEMSPAEARSLGTAVNALTGKGDMNSIGMGGEKAQNFLNKIMISAPWLMSRLQVLTLHPFWSKGSTAESRKAAAELYVDMAAGISAYYGLVVLAGMFMADDDEEKPVVEWDSTSSDFMKVRIGRTRLDPLFGLQQIIVLASRIYHDEIKDSGGVVRPRKGFEDDWALISRFQEGRLHPAIQDIRALKTGEDFMGQPITKTEVLKGAVMPITYPAIDDAAKGRGIPAQTALAVWAIAGGGLSTYDPRTKEREDIASELQRIQRKLSNPNTSAETRKSLRSESDAMLESHLINAVKYDSKNKGLAKQVEDHKPGVSVSPELAMAVQKEKHDIALRAVESLSAEDRNGDKGTGDDAGITTARDLLRQIAPTVEEANVLFTEAYRKRHGSPMETVRGRRSTKKSVAASRARLREIYKD